MEIEQRHYELETRILDRKPPAHRIPDAVVSRELSREFLDFLHDVTKAVS